MLINLLPWRETQMRRRAHRWLLLLWLQAGMMFCFIAALYLIWYGRQQRAQETLDAVQIQQQQLVARYQQTHLAQETLRRHQVQEHAEAIVRQDNRRNLRLFEQLASIMPARLWLTEMADGGSHLLLSGVGESYHDIVMLQHALLRHISVERVRLLHTFRDRDANAWLRFSFQVDWRDSIVSPAGDAHD
ncbi:PilN domain-containing protein [Pectobacterium cacticida]|uniref:PilN domain-containing protein n=1 Tax=Pectobacterium cacticida TaxID=69221 RepID=UPI002FEE8EBB